MALDELERIARDAAEHLPGEWRTCTDEDDPASVAFLDKHAGEERWMSFAHCSGGCLEWVHASEHIATFDPPTVLQIIAEQRGLLAALQRNRAALDLIDPARPLQYATTMDLMRRDMDAAIAKVMGASA